MGFLLALILLIIALISFCNERTLGSPLVLFSAEWSLIFFLASLRLYGLYDVSLKTWAIAAVGSFCFILGCAFSKRVKVKYNNIREDDEFIPIMSERTFWILFAFLILLSAGKIQNSISILLSGSGLSQVRLIAVGLSDELSTEIFGLSAGISSILNMVKNAINAIVIATGINFFFENTKIYKKQLIAIVFLILINTFTSGGRFELAYFVVELVVCFEIYRKKNHFHFTVSKKIKRRIRTGIMVITGIVIYVTILRGTSKNGVTTQLYQYLCGNMVLLDIFTNRIDINGIVSFPYASFYGIFQIIIPFLHLIGFSHPVRYTMTQNFVMITQNWMQVGENLYMNAFVTPFYSLYSDARWFGLIFGMGLFGFLAVYFYKKATINFQGRDIVIYLLISQMMFKSLQQYPFSSETYAMIFFIVLFTSRRVSFGKKTARSI